MARPSADEVVRGEGARLAEAIGSRLSRLYHPGVAAICGPYLRAYGLSLDRHVSLAGLWLALAGTSGVIPARLDVYTAHVHDLYFLPMFERLADLVTPHLHIEEVTSSRHHEQQFKHVVAVSHLDESRAVGCERGRVPRFAKGQYYPFIVHFQSGPTTVAFGVKLGNETATLDADPSDEVHTTLGARAQYRMVELVLEASETVTIDGAAISLGGLTLEATSEPDELGSTMHPSGQQLRAIWRKPEVALEATLNTV